MNWEDHMSRRFGQIAAACVALTFSAPFAQAQEIELILAIPAPTLTFSSAFIAEDAGFYKQAGLKVTHRNLVGVASINAVIAGSADFTIGTGPVFLRAAAQGQRLLTIVNLIDKPLVEMVMRKDVADAAGITEKSSFADRAKALKGKTIGIQGVGSIIHAWQRLVTARAGLDVEKDVRIAPMDPPAMLPAMENKAIDGFATSLPFTTQAVMKGSAIMLASAVTDVPDLLPFAYGLVQTKPETCQQAREKCLRIVQALRNANKMITERPDEALALLKKRFDKLDPVLLAAAFKIVSQAHAKDVRVTIPGLENSQKVSLEAKLLKPEDALKSYDGLFTAEFVK
jgi:ABC-type nitrate/sulfonate/bicarbonate transport system substrate-binding protein